MNDRTIRVWDLAVRTFHWSLLFFCIVAYVSGEEESDIHAYAGYGVAALLLFRMVWGFIGPEQARFSSFIQPPARVKEYLYSLMTGNPQHYLGHNPAAGWMIMLLMLSLCFVVFSGLKTYGAEGHGPLANMSSPSLISAVYANGDDDDDEHEEKERRARRNAYRSRDSHHERREHHEEDEGEEYWEELHEASVSFTILLVFMHIVGAITASLLHHENLIKSMITGKKISKAS